MRRESKYSNEDLSWVELSGRTQHAEKNGRHSGSPGKLHSGRAVAVAGSAPITGLPWRYSGVDGDWRGRTSAHRDTPIIITPRAGPQPPSSHPSNQTLRASPGTRFNATLTFSFPLLFFPDSLSLPLTLVFLLVLLVLLMLLMLLMPCPPRASPPTLSPPEPPFSPPTLVSNPPLPQLPVSLVGEAVLLPASDTQ